jgi:UDP-glucose 4-epimerase
MTNVLITGASGYIGSATKELFKETHFNVFELDFDSINLLDYPKVKSFVYENKIDVVLHLAAFKSIPDSKSNPIKYLHNNIGSSLNIISVCEDFKIPLINASTAAVYGSSNAYSESKIAVEKFLESSHIDYINLRYFNIGGLIDRPNNKQISNLFDVIRFKHFNNKKFIVNGNDSLRNYTHVKDIARFNIESVIGILNGSVQKSIDVYSSNMASVEDVILIYKGLGVIIDYEVDYSGPSKEPILPSGEGLIKDSMGMIDIVQSEIKYGIVLDNRI